MADQDTNLEETDSLVDTKYKKPVRLSLHLIVKRHLPSEASKWSQERIIMELDKIRRVRLDRENIGEIDSMELLSSEVTNLYLQSNQIKCVENLDCLPNLQVLVLSCNQITEVEGVSHLQKLVFLDLSDNNISEANPDSFPKSLVILNMKDNPCTSKDGHREVLLNSLPKLKQLDGADFIEDEIDSSECLDDDDGEDEGEEDSTENDRLGSGNDMVSPFASSHNTFRGSLESAYQQLPTIQASIQDITTEMLMRSQNRLEETCSEHKRHIQEITNAKIKSKIRPLPSISKPS